ncbi:hypothetical protein [Coraliomargarita parva]|uniref:hypothetical protein n=1 Tax=Coraliomargarita parva TaxID=3014050 RepID=UPI0022B58BB5|nr:hypothetical protein [Coraliomargarita parva]
MTERPDSWSRYLQLATASYSFFWLLAANLVGLWLAALLVWPHLGDLVPDWTYGRWMPLHMDWQLYGWCSLPLVGLLMRYFMSPSNGSTRMDIGIGYGAWSVALFIGGFLSLQGEVSGKLFLNWSGVGRIAFPVAQMVLFSVLAAASVGRYRRIGKFDTKQWLQALLLLVLIASPVSLFITSGRKVYPPIDPESGGATGHSLLASTLGIILIFGFLPYLLRIRGKARARKLSRFYAGAYLASLCVWALIGHGNASNRSAGQVVGLGVLLAWVPMIAVYFRAFEWPVQLRPWLLAFLFWWGFLTVDGFITFLPGVLDVLKFTNGMVAHAHLAMAGMLGALNMLVLGTLGRAESGDPWTDRAGFWLWQSGTLIYVLAMLVQGVREGLDPTVLFGGNALTQTLYLVRLLAGGLLVSASARWAVLLLRVELKSVGVGGAIRT